MDYAWRVIQNKKRSTNYNQTNLDDWVNIQIDFTGHRKRKSNMDIRNEDDTFGKYLLTCVFWFGIAIHKSV